MRTRLPVFARAIVAGRIGISAANERMTFSVIASVLFWLMTIATRTSNGSLPLAQFATRSRRQRMSNALRKDASSTASPLHEGAEHRHKVARPLPQTPQEIRKPVRPVRDVFREAEALRRELPLERVS